MSEPTSPAPSGVSSRFRDSTSPPGNKDKRLVFNTPCAYALACQAAKENGTLAGYLQEVADELSAFDSGPGSSSEDVFAVPDEKGNVIGGNPAQTKGVIQP